MLPRDVGELRVRGTSPPFNKKPAKPPARPFARRVPAWSLCAAKTQNQAERGIRVEQVEVAVIGTGWCGGIRAETLSRSALVDKLHICEIRPDRLVEGRGRWPGERLDLDQPVRADLADM